MKKLDPQIVTAIRQHAQDNPQDSYAKIAATFGVSLASVKRLCSDQGRSKAWRKGKGAPEFDPQKFWDKIDRGADGCWQWTGCTNNDGYGFVFVNGKSCGAHRVAYQLANGPIPDGLEIDHLCKNPGCCNPAHLDAVTHQENMKRIGLAPPPTVPRMEPAAARIDPMPLIDTGGNGDLATPKKTDAPILSSQQYPLRNRGYQ
jgi:hypothetical protein